MGRRQVSGDARKIARERIVILFARAEQFFPSYGEGSDRCVALARRIAMRHRVRIPRHLRRRYCRRCGAFLVPGVNLRVRIRRGKVVATCLRCRRQRRYCLGRRSNGQTHDT
ncbi:MAG: ribonuclease subunit [Methanomicrobia archaeon]|nr:ribonuclease subunit [Methanomicrobia archaeon]